MLQILSRASKQIRCISLDAEVESDAIWYDLIDPTPAEIAAIEKTLSIHIPSLLEMSEIEESSRLYEEGCVLYMTALLIASADTAHPSSQPVAFIITAQSLLTVRYAPLKSFQNFEKKVAKNGFLNAQLTFIGLMETVVERVADVLEMNAAEIDTVSGGIFKNDHVNATKTMQANLVHIGKIGHLNSIIRETLVTLDRLLIFYDNQLPEECEKKISAKMETIQKDVKSLVNYVSFLFGKIEFLLEATLGFINIEQNSIIKFFSVAAVIFLPPMVIASIYGMNFAKIPELHWVWGYPFALLLMVLSAILPYLYFKRKGWL